MKAATFKSAVSWPDLQDRTGLEKGEGVAEAVGNIGLAIAHYDTSDIVRGKFGVAHDQSILIGLWHRS